MNKRLLGGLLAAGIIGGGVYGFAATLGFESDNLAAGSDVVEACDSAVTVTYTVDYSPTSGGYIVDDVVIGGIDATECAGQMLDVTLSGASDAELAARTVTIDAATESFDFDTSAVLGEGVTGVHVAIDGVDVISAG